MPAADQPPPEATSSTTATDPPGLDLTRLRRHLDSALPDTLTGPLSATVITGGRSNLSYDLTDGTHRWVLRRPPLGHVLATAHDMTREHRVISALSDGPVPTPQPVLLCTDEDVLGAPFYLMDFVEGQVLRSADDAARLDAGQLRTLGNRLVDVLATLHAVEPATVGLEDFGRPDGYLERQVRRWSGQLEQSRSRDVSGFDALRDRLAASVPTTQRNTVVHGDFRLANAILTQDQHIAAVLDWEMSTLGDPLTDLAILRLYSDADGPASAPELGEPTLPDVPALLRRYADQTGLDLEPLPWYRAFANFKLAVILEGIHYRYQQGKTVGAGFEHIGERVPTLVTGGHAVLDEKE